MAYTKNTQKRHTRWFNPMDNEEDLTDPSFKRYWDDVAKAPFLYNGDFWITYEDAESLAYKVKIKKSDWPM